MKEPPPVEQEMATEWFSAVSNLPSYAVVVAVLEFFHLSWTWNQIGPSTGLTFSEFLCLLYRVFQVLAETEGDASLIRNLIQKGFNWPERFGFILERTRIGGENVIHALEKVQELIPEIPLVAENSLVDFALETGWYLLGNENLPVWRAVGRNGESLLRKLRGFSIQMESIRILSGFLGRLEETDQLQKLLEDSIPRKIEKIVGLLEEPVLSEVIEMLSEDAIRALVRRSEIDLCLDIMAIQVRDSSPFEYGQAIADIMLFSRRGKAERSIFEDVYALCAENENTGLIIEIARMSTERRGTSFYDKLKTEYYLRFIPIALSILEGKEKSPEIRRVINSIGRLMDAVLSQDDPSISLESLEKLVAETEINFDKLLPALILLLRSTNEALKHEHVLKSEIFVLILDLLDDNYSRRLLEGEQTHWLSPLANGTIDSCTKVVEALEKISNRSLRSRFMDKVIAPLFQEIGAEELIFSELITSAVSTYNREMSLEQLRDKEITLLGRLFRAEDRSKALKVSMNRLLRIPGIEEKSANDLIYCARTLCETLSQQAVWLEKSGHRIFSRFLSRGLTAFVKTLVEYPEISEHLTSGNLMKELLTRMIPAKETEDSNVALWQLKTASVFFGETIPYSVEILTGRPELVISYLRDITELAVGSMHGELAGATFLSWMSHRLEKKLIDEYARKLDNGFTITEVQRDIEGSQLMNAWRAVRDSSSEILRDTVDSLKAVTQQILHRKIIIREGRKLVEGFIENGCKELILKVSVSPDRKEVTELQKAAGDSELIEIFRIMEGREPVGKKKQPPEKVEQFFLSRESKCPPGENSCRYWRSKAFSPLENVLIDIILLYTSNESLSKIEQMMDDFVEIIGYLGTDEVFRPSIIFTALEKSLSKTERGKRLTVQMVEKNLEKNIYRLMWRRKATKKTAESVSEYVPEKKITNMLFDRITRERTSREQILFTKKYARIFASVESIIMKRKNSEIQSARSVLQHIWIFNSEAVRLSSAVEIARDAVETITQFFLEIGARTGAVTAPEAGAISLGMRRKYRDNANTVAILIRWTQDTTRENLLALVEAHHPLLEAVSRDSELIQLIDNLWGDGKARLYIRSLADRPDRLKERLLHHLGVKARENRNGIRYV
ncbi:MAG: hypothetical protein KAW14_11060 [Candidatus Aegiribacteria sp.]|nr:hypothetical protein [Candidatus Aegiribacteria sp.]